MILNLAVLVYKVKIPTMYYRMRQEYLWIQTLYYVYNKLFLVKTKKLRWEKILEKTLRFFINIGPEIPN